MPALPQVLILHDEVAANAPPEALDTLHQAQAIQSALRELGYAVTALPVSLNLQWLQHQLQGAAPTVVVNLVESPGGSDRLAPLVPALLDQLGIAYTGCGFAAMLRLADKTTAKHWLRSHAVATPDWWCPGAEPAGSAGDGPWIVKSVWEHASFGLTEANVVHTLAAARQVVQRCEAQHGGDWFAEHYVAGREFNVALLEASTGLRVLPLAEIVFDGYPDDRPRIVDYAAKWLPDSFAAAHTVRRFMDANAEVELAARLRAAALDTWRHCGLRGYARVDFRVDAMGQPWVVDVNPNPCLATDAGFAAAAEAAGMNYPTLIGALLAPLAAVDQRRVS